jgi:hypothetical protein
MARTRAKSFTLDDNDRFGTGGNTRGWKCEGGYTPFRLDLSGYKCRITGDLIYGFLLEPTTLFPKLPKPTTKYDLLTRTDF